MFKKRLSTSSKLLLGVVLSLLFVLGGFSKHIENPLKRFENRSIDYRFLIRGSKPQNLNLPIVLVYIDNESTLEYGYRSPTPRKLLADLVDHLDAKGAKVIGIDVILDRSYQTQDDEVLGKIFERAGKKVVLVTGPPNADTQNIAGDISTSILPRFASLTHQGFAESKSDADDFHRWVNLGQYGNRVHFAVKILQIYSDKQFYFPEKLHIDQKNPYILINFPGPPSRLDASRNFMVFAANQIPFVPEDFIKDKIVIIGSAIEDLGDTFLIPFSTEGNGYMRMFGVEYHTILLKMFFEDNFLFELTKLHKILLMALFFFIAAAGFLFFKPLGALIFLPACMLIWSAVSVYMFLYHNLVFPVAYPVAALILIFILCQWLIYSTEVKHSRFLKNTFQYYIPPALVEQLVSKQEEVALGGIKDELTIFFSDLKDFTTVSEQMGPESLMDFLNMYFEEMTQILFKENGTLDKYIGDAVMAFFGAPTPLPDHATHACRVALMMMKKLEELNRNPIEKWIPVDIRIGINTGLVIVGNSGSKTRFNYTVMGDTVNLASRLEGVNKLFGSHILVSEFTLKSIKEYPVSEEWSKFFTRELGRFIVKGKVNTVAVYELFDFEENITDKQKELKARYEEALQKFYQHDFIKAKELFIRLIEELHDKASEFMLQQIHYFVNNPPEDDWGGEIALLTK